MSFGMPQIMAGQVCTHTLGQSSRPAQNRPAEPVKFKSSSFRNRDVLSVLSSLFIFEKSTSRNRTGPYELFLLKWYRRIQIFDFFQNFEKSSKNKKNANISVKVWGTTGRWFPTKSLAIQKPHKISKIILRPNLQKFLIPVRRSLFHNFIIPNQTDFPQFYFILANFTKIKKKISKSLSLESILSV